MSSELPDNIWLHWETADVFWWYPDQQGEHDVKYVQCDLVESTMQWRDENIRKRKELQAENERMREAVRWMIPGSMTCGYDCHWINTYGFVPEAGCPDHDISSAALAETDGDK